MLVKTEWISLFLIFICNICRGCSNTQNIKSVGEAVIQNLGNYIKTLNYNMIAAFFLEFAQ